MRPPKTTRKTSRTIPSRRCNPGAQVTALSGRVLTKKTKPPTRYTLASLVRELENRGIGRPSTFAAILDTIQTREYIKEEKRYLVPTPLGVQVVDALVNAFSFVDYAFTKEMEQALDDIASGKDEISASCRYGFQSADG